MPATPATLAEALYTEHRREREALWRNGAYEYTIRLWPEGAFVIVQIIRWDRSHSRQSRELVLSRRIDTMRDLQAVIRHHTRARAGLTSVWRQLGLTDFPLLTDAAAQEAFGEIAYQTVYRNSVGTKELIVYDAPYPAAILITTIELGRSAIGRRLGYLQRADAGHLRMRAQQLYFSDLRAVQFWAYVNGPWTVDTDWTALPFQPITDGYMITAPWKALTAEAEARYTQPPPAQTTDDLFGAWNDAVLRGAREHGWLRPEGLIHQTNAVTQSTGPRLNYPIRRTSRSGLSGTMFRKWSFSIRSNVTDDE